MATKRKVPARKSPAKAKRAVTRVMRAAPAKARATVQPISPCLWFDSQAEEAARFYVSIFSHGKIEDITRYPAVGQDVHGRPAGSVMTVEFVLNGLAFTALNGGPVFQFNEAVSFQILCDTQAEIDHYWAKLSQGGDEKAQACGWLKDRYGVSWQVAPKGMARMMKDPKSPATERVFAAMMKMRKLDMAELQAAYKGKS